MRTIVAVVICGIVALPASAPASADVGTLLRTASRLSGLPARYRVPTATLGGSRYDASLRRAVTRSYPRSLQRVDERLYALLGLAGRSTRPPVSRAWYDAAGRRLLLRRAPRAGRAQVIHELVRALVDQNFGLRRLERLRLRDRDAALAATAIIDGAAALASGRRATPLRGTALDRFLQLRREAGAGPGRALAAELRYLGGRPAVATALRTFPQTTEQLLHVDKFLERERPRRVGLVAGVGDLRLASSQTFGELEVRNLLRAFAVPGAAAAAEGWGGGRLALYVRPDGAGVGALVLRWDTSEAAARWRETAAQFVAAAFPGAAARDCPPLDRCWANATAEVAVGVFGDTTVLVSGPGSQPLAAALLHS